MSARWDDRIVHAEDGQVDRAIGTVDRPHDRKEAVAGLHDERNLLVHCEDPVVVDAGRSGTIAPPKTAAQNDNSSALP
jgi:hypothetical protein